MSPLRLTLKDVGKYYKDRPILEDINFDLDAGDTLGIMGPSGVGKTTLARIIAGTVKPDTGTILWDGLNMGSKKNLRQNRSRVQLMPQDPTAALNPLKTVQTLLSEVPELRRQLRSHREQAPADILEQVGLSTDVLTRHPDELSGGMNQRVMLARLFLAHPDLIIFDEPTSGLDLSLQAMILHLIRANRDRFGYSYVFISHDIEVIRFMCRRTIYLKGGQMEKYTIREECHAARYP